MKKTYMKPNMNSIALRKVSLLSDSFQMNMSSSNATEEAGSRSFSFGDEE
jgi:hypothetical protein